MTRVDNREERRESIELPIHLVVDVCKKFWVEVFYVVTCYTR